MEQNKLKWHHWLLIVLVFLLVLFGVPYLLNITILAEQWFPIIAEGKDWLLFWSAWLSAIASFVMVFFTWRTLRQNKVQINELKRKHDNDDLGVLIYSLINYQKSIDELKLQDLLEQISTKDYDRISRDTKDLLNKFSDESFALNIYIARVRKTREINEFNKIYNNIYKEYGSVMCDIFRLCDFLRDMPEVDITKYVEKELTILEPSINESNDLASYIRQYFVEGVNIDNAICRTALSLMENNKIAEYKTELKKQIELLISAQQDIINNTIKKNNGTK